MDTLREQVVTTSRAVNLYVLNMFAQLQHHPDSLNISRKEKRGNAGDTDIIVSFSLTSLTAALCLCATMAQAQPAAPGDTPVGGTSRPGDVRPALPQPGTLPDATLDVPIDSTPDARKRAPATQTMPYGAKVFVNEIRLSGSTVFDIEVFRDILSPYENREVTSGELEDVRIQLTRYYVDRGYINSGAVLPDQKVIDGIITIKIIEGSLNEIDVTGNRHLSDS